MALTERQATLVHLMTTPYADARTCLRKVTEFIVAAPLSEWTNLAEVFLYGWSINSRKEAEQTEPHGLRDEDIEQAGITLQHMVEVNTIESMTAIVEKRPARQVAEAIARDLERLQSEGFVAQCTLLFSISTQVVPYLGSEEIPPDGPVDLDFNRSVIIANPRMFALIQKGLFDRRATKSQQLISMAEHIIARECTTRNERLAVLSTLVYLVAKKGQLKQDIITAIVGIDLDPIDPKTAN